MFGFGEQTSYLRCEFLYRAGDSALPVVDGYHRAMTRSGLTFSYFKGNDSLLHYTLVDWSSGARRMVDLYHQVRALWHKRKHPGEWLYAAFRADLLMGEQDDVDSRPDMDSSDRLELSEIGVRLAYNGRAFLSRETMSMVATCHATGIVVDADPEHQARNLDVFLDAFTGAWCETKPLFGWIGIGTRPDVDVPPLVGANRVPRNAWFAFYPPGMADEIRHTAQQSRGALVSADLGDGSLLLENVRRRPGGITGVSPGLQHRRCS